ncbi:MAG: NIPSNAP family protein, partial [Verrucomicrobiota bacterium]
MQISRFPVLLFSVLALFFGGLQAESKDERVFEMRTYYAAPGKLDDLHARFRDHTCALFEKHGMTNIGYWVPVENEGEVLIYLLAYPDREARSASWKAFKNDPAWQAAYQASTAKGKLVQKIDSVFLTTTVYSPPFSETLEGKEIVELRTYTTNPGKLPNLDARFRDHTVRLFTKHGITNLPYFHLMDDQEGNEVTLTYFVAFDSVDQREAAFASFREDPDWQKAAKESQVDGR